MKISFKLKCISFLSILLTTLVYLFFAGIIFSCTKQTETIKIGVATTLTGPASTSGIHSRNAAMLAAEQINASGGINGRPVELLVRDDKGRVEDALLVDKDLIDNGVVAIIGHYLSSLSVKVVPLLNENRVLMISSGSTSSELTGQDDFFIRLMVPDDKRSAVMVDMVLERLKFKKMAVIYDLSNPNYTIPFSQHFQKNFEQKGGEITASIAFNSLEQYSSPDIAQKIIDSRAEGVFLITNAINGALFSQHLRKIDSEIKITASAWTFPEPDFVRNGGKAVEGVTCLVELNPDASNSRFQEFKTQYKQRFDEDIGINAYIAFEAAQILIDALQKTNDPAKLKAVILNQKTYQGLTDSIIIDEYGDPSRPLYILEIQDSRIKTVGKMEADAG